MELDDSSGQLDRNNNGSNETVNWTNLPPDVIQEIAQYFEIVDLLRFKSVCKDWNYGSLIVSPKFESKPWLLTYGTTAECSLITSSGKKHTVDIPQLEGTTCIASNNGWLLFFKEGSMFFFCPLSRAKIDLPKFPCSDFKDHIAAFSCPPTSARCIVCVLYRIDKNLLQLSSLHHGSGEWYQQEYCMLDSRFRKCKMATYWENSFHFYDDTDYLLEYSFRNHAWRSFKLLDSTSTKDNNTDTLPYTFTKGLLNVEKTMKKSLDLAAGVSFSTCGTLTKLGSLPTMVFHENNESPKEDKDKVRVKGVWLHPQLFKVPSTYKWSS